MIPNRAGNLQNACIKLGHAMAPKPNIYTIHLGIIGRHESMQTVYESSQQAGSRPALATPAATRMLGGALHSCSHPGEGGGRGQSRAPRANWPVRAKNLNPCKCRSTSGPRFQPCGGQEGGQFLQTWKHLWVRISALCRPNMRSPRLHFIFIFFVFVNLGVWDFCFVF